jgi:hypothetical protein
MWHPHKLTPFPDPVEVSREIARKQKETEIERLRIAREDERRHQQKQRGV